MSRIKRRSQHMAAPKKRKNRLSLVLIILGIVMLLISGGILLYSQWRYIKQDEVNAELASYATLSDDSDDGAPLEIDWEGLKAVNSEIVGWIYIPGTVINYPVYQHSNNSYYLNINAYGQSSVGGQIFLDYENTAPGMQDYQTILYGHNLRNGAMFKQIADMDNQEMFDSITTVWYLTEDAVYELEPLLCYYTEATNSKVRRFSFDSEKEFQEYLLELLADSVTSAEDATTKITNTSNVLTLATCNYIEGKGRTVLVCVPKESS